MTYSGINGVNYLWKYVSIRYASNDAVGCGGEMILAVSNVLKYTFLIHFFIKLFFGAVYFLIPEMFLGMIGWPLEVSMDRVFGAMFLGIAVLAFLGFRADSWEKVEIVVKAELAWNLLGLIAVVWAMLTMTLPLIGWAMAGLFGLFFILFLYCYMTR